jgi:uncharacterized protein YaeQ
MEFRVALANVDRGVQRSEAVILARHPSETMERVVLRVLAWCALYEEGITFGPGLCEPDAPDLLVRGEADRFRTWIACGSARWETLRRAIRANAGVSAHVVLSDLRRRDDLLAEIADAKEARALSMWTIDRALVTSLAEREDRRRKWDVTISGDHCYVVEGDVTVDGAIERVR